MTREHRNLGQLSSSRANSNASHVTRHPEGLRADHIDANCCVTSGSMGTKATPNS